ncbi:scavenger receptor cysteine-rich domain superfamily protein-like isoform X2 [Acanthaster planci]|nr:scavenger receptor cysteine-rich domain superfamily protein-like isoform X2 [Acanthaster planci]XP_022086605.1 scavenger receptor cysteine-rich domain superfamily protein-like isoform X2 [Acanthaster planci]
MIPRACFLAWLLTLCMTHSPVSSQEDGNFRLVPYGISLSRLEVYHSGSWGPVCAENWALRESVVLCTQMGFRFVGNWDRADVGRVTPAKLGNVQCHGDESSILDCKHGPLGENRNCSDGLVTVYCTETVGGTVSLKDGESFSEGRVEVRLQFRNKTFYYTICDEGWDLADADRVCRGRVYTYDSALEAVRGSYFGEHAVGESGLDGKFDGFLTSSVQCNASYYSVLDCPNSGWFTRSCPSGKTAGVKCKEFSDQYQVNLTLVDGTSRYNGFVKVAINSVPSGSICDSNRYWSLREGDVVCRSLGFGYALNVSVVKSSLEPRINNVHCNGNEMSLSQCLRGGLCPQRGELAPTVNCSGPLKAGYHPIELRPSQIRFRGAEGLLRILRNGRWGTVCNASWTLENARVVCRQLGYSSVIRHWYSFHGYGPIHLSNVKCAGTEPRLDQCQHDSWGVHDGCSHAMDVAVECGSITLTVNFTLIAVLASMAKFVSHQ